MYSLSLSLGHVTHESESTWPLHFKHSHWWKRRSLSKFTSHYSWRNNGVHEYELDVKSAWIHSYMASNGSFFMVIGTTSKNHLLDVGLSQDRKIMTLRTLTILNLLSIYHVWGPHEYIFIEIIAFGWGPRSQTTSRYTLESVTTLSYMNGLWTLTFFRALTISWSQLVARWPLI